MQLSMTAVAKIRGSQNETSTTSATRILQDFGLKLTTDQNPESQNMASTPSSSILVVASFASGCSCSGGAVVDLAHAIRGRKLRLVILEPQAQVNRDTTSKSQGPSPQPSSMPRLFQRALEITKSQTEFEFVGSTNSASFAKWKIAKTPEVLVFDREGRLAYQGAITADPKGEEKPEAFLSQVLDDLESGRPARWTKREAFGCALPFGPLAR